VPGTNFPESRSQSGPSGLGDILLANRLALLIVVPLFLVLAAVSFLTVKFAGNERAEQQWVLHTYRVIDQLHLILGDVQDAETGQRGYLLTRKQEFLHPYSAGVTKAHRDIAAFRKLTADNPEQQQRALLLQNLANDRLDALHKSLSAEHPIAQISPELLGALQDGKQRMDALRGLIEAGVRAEDRLLTQRVKARKEADDRSATAAMLAALAAFFILMLAAIALIRSNVALASSERKRANDAAILQTTLDSIRDGVAMFTMDGSLCVFNSRFFELLDFPLELAQLSESLANFQNIDRRRSSQVFADIPDSPTDIEQGYQRLSLKGRELDVYRAPVPTGGFIIACMDVTARVRAEDAARQTQKMEAIGHLTGGVAHDFNNLLQIVSANLDMLSRECTDSPVVVERIHKAVAAVDRGARLTGQLLAFARRQPLEPRSLNLGRLVHDMTDLLRHTLGERVEIDSMVSGGLWNTLADPSRIENAIINLAVNARDAMPEGGKLTIEVANAFLDDNYSAQHAEVAAGQYVMLAVSDTGQGMAPDVIAHAFEPFYTTKPEGQGTGLGLSQVYGFVKQSGGHIKIYSEPRQGTTIKIYLPRTRRDEEKAEHSNMSPVTGGRESILVVEDDEGVRAAVVDMLNELGYHVLKAANANKALEIIAGSEHIDLIFTDVVMPGPINTREFGRRAVEMRPNVAVLYTSGYTQNAIVHNGSLDDDVYLLSKPYRRDDLARKIRSMLSNDRKVQTQQASATAPSTATKGQRRVLVVEDIALIRMTTVDMLDSLGCASVEAATAQEAIDAFTKDGAIDLVLTDVGLPDMSGNELVKKLRAIRSVPIIIASGYESGPAKGEMQSADTAYLPKPFDLDQLQRALAKV
jgi:signal transduction histidine kinase/DNA-binding response OmpR family regulator